MRAHGVMIRNMILFTKDGIDNLKNIIKVRTDADDASPKTVP